MYKGYVYTTCLFTMLFLRVSLTQQQQKAARGTGAGAARVPAENGGAGWDDTSFWQFVS